MQYCTTPAAKTTPRIANNVEGKQVTVVVSMFSPSSRRGTCSGGNDVEVVIGVVGVDVAVLFVSALASTSSSSFVSCSLSSFRGPWSGGGDFFISAAVLIILHALRCSPCFQWLT